MRLVLTACSFEDRCRALPGDLQLTSSGDPAVVLNFKGYEDVGPYLFNRAKMVNELKGKGYTVEVVDADITSPLVALGHIESLVKSSGPSDVLFDVSSMPRNYLFALCRFLGQSGVPSMLRYYKPLDYGSDLSRGVRTIQAIPGFEGDLAPNGEVVLALILGFEGYKAMHAWERIGPTKTIAFIGDPPYESEFLGISRKQNRELFEEVDVEELALHTYDVAIAMSQLQVAYDQSTRSMTDASFILCPLGTKLQSLAALGFAHQNRDVTVAYVSSIAYFTEEYSRGWREDCIDIPLSSLLETLRSR